MNISASDISVTVNILQDGFFFKKSVTVTHIPTGISTTSSSERSEHKNKQIAFEMLHEKLRMANLDCVNHFDVLKVDYDMSLSSIKILLDALETISSGEAKNGCILCVNDCIDIANNAIIAHKENSNGSKNKT